MPYREETLMKIAAFAVDAHRGQPGKLLGECYIEHPVRVMYACMSTEATLPTLCAALLHDTLEKTSVTSEKLSDFLYGTLAPQSATQVLNLVLELSEVYTVENYPNWTSQIRKAAEFERLKRISSAAQTIKYADIIDNLSAIIVLPPALASERITEYGLYLDVLNAGNSPLRNKAKQSVLQTYQKLLSAKFW